MNKHWSERQLDVNGLSMHVVEQGSGPAVVLCHGFPELWYSWRHQIPAIAAAGFRAIAPDMRGYGRTSAPPRIEDYGMQQITADMAALLDVLELKDAIFVGHDWGGIVVWSMALHYPDRVRAVAGVNTPFMERAAINPDWVQPGSKWDYQIYFNEVGRPEAELSRNVRRTFTLFFRTSKSRDGGDSSDVVALTKTVTARGGFLVGLPEEMPRSIMLTQEDLDYFVSEYERTGFRGGLNWYRNVPANWRWGEKIVGKKVLQPALMVTAGKDAVLTPDMTEGMEHWVPSLTRGHIEQCAHWTQQEEPEQLNQILLDWLRSL
jgi:soluble epoxide hydrolase/lipid-phosphate phosphatase